MTTLQFSLKPTIAHERITLLDSLRGIAVLGILLMNIPGFALPYGQIFDPAIKGEMEGPNFLAYYIPELILEGSQRAMFSLLFGASVLLFLERLTNQVDGLRAAEYFIRRQLWLLVFGLFNAYILLWFWDVLFHYALLGIVLFAFCRMPPKTLILAALVCLCMGTVRENIRFQNDHHTIKRGIEAAAIDTTKTKLVANQIDDLKAMQALHERSSEKSKRQRIHANIRKVRGSYSDLYEAHSERSYENETAGMFYFLVWDGLIFMFLGMAFFKNGWLLGKGPIKVYWLLFIVGLGVGIPLSYIRLQPMITHQFNYFEIAKSGGIMFYEISRFFRALGFFGMTMLLYRSGVFGWLFRLFRPVGQMAFTNYLLQSVICGAFFYGIGLGYFGSLQRYEIYYVVIGVWIFEIILSHAWIRLFNYGPLEWIWRCLTYWKIYPIRKPPVAK